MKKYKNVEEFLGKRLSLSLLEDHEAPPVQVRFANGDLMVVYADGAWASKLHDQYRQYAIRVVEQLGMLPEGSAYTWECARVRQARQQHRKDQLQRARDLADEFGYVLTKKPTEKGR